MKRLIHIVAYAILGLGLLASGLVAYWSLQSGDVLVIKNQPVPVRPSEVNPEATVILTYDYCKNSDAVGTINRSLVSHSTKILAPDQQDTTRKTCAKIDVPVIIPGQTPDGVYHMEYTLTYKINPIKTVVLQYRTQEFTVKHEPPLPAQTIVPSTMAPGSSNQPAVAAQATPTAPGVTPVPSTSPSPSPLDLPQRILNFIKGLL